MGAAAIVDAARIVRLRLARGVVDVNVERLRDRALNLRHVRTVPLVGLKTRTPFYLKQGNGHAFLGTIQTVKRTNDFSETSATVSKAYDFFCSACSSEYMNAISFKQENGRYVFR